VFQDSNGIAIKFFIQKDLPTELQAELCETVTVRISLVVSPLFDVSHSLQALGGRVEAKVPRQGYILIRPHTGEAERLTLCWDSPDRPERHFVPYTYVEACKIAGMLLKQIFVENGEPIKFHIDSSIANINARAALSSRIMVGRVVVYVIQTRLINGLVSTLEAIPAHLPKRHV
jgi:hypothetical protein